MNERWDLLPSFLQVRKLPQFMGGTIASKLTGVRVLADTERVQIEHQVFGAFPAANSIEVDWEKVPHQYFATESESELVSKLKELVEVWGADERVTLLWLGLPAVELPSSLATTHMTELVQASGSLSLACLSRSVLIECSLSGDIVVASTSSA